MMSIWVSCGFIVFIYIYMYVYIYIYWPDAQCDHEQTL